LKRAKQLSSKVVTKSGVMLGLGEKETELFQTMDDLRDVGCEVLTMGQYLRPSPKHCLLSNTSRRTNSITTAISHVKRVSSTSPPGRWSAAPITQLIFIRWLGDDGRGPGPARAIALETAAVIPAYREEKHISDIVRRTRQELDHVLVVTTAQKIRRRRERAKLAPK
jgi:hypothetical protein